MDNLKDELIEMIDIFDYYKIPENKQRSIITSGVYFEFDHNDTKRLDCFDFAKLLILCKNIDPEFDANKMLKDLNNRRDSDYELLVKFYCDLDKKRKAKILTK